MSNAPILIIGTGVSGLSLAHGLNKANIPFRLFERDPSFDVRAQGYRVRIDHIGSKALQETLPSDLFAQVRNTCAPFLPGGARLDARSAEALQGGGGPPPPGKGEAEPLSADRTVLRRVLMRGLEAHIAFGKRFVEYEITAGGVKVRFSDGTEVEGSLLVGADGAKSAVRRQFLPELRPVDVEGRLIYGKTPLTPELEEKFDKRAMGASQRCATPPTPTPDVLGITDAELLGLSTEEAAALARKLTADWHPSLRILFTLQDATQTSALALSSVKPEIHRWEPSERVTCIGDSIHGMLPAAGIGANTALRDAALLSKTLADKGRSAEAIGSYEAAMREYAGQAVAMSHMGGKHLFGMKAFEELKPATL
ncbi:cercosporin toxin biosynthesis protein [Mycena metata]|uniref:Cercosporin toxin biosynthesis protein n=1 Tax=Mycena metata TaxID=1033252 RepID=A0AAD7KH64_9AGAR|nr:cercosporin toxin biosynthesis protein [Mycena metata]